MDNCYEMARELGNAILASDVGIKMTAARKNFYENEAAVKKTNEYSAYQNEIQNKMRAGSLTPEEAQGESRKLAEMLGELKKDEIVNNLIEAEDAFAEATNRIMAILKATITGEDTSCSGCSGSCGGGCSCG